MLIQPRCVCLCVVNDFRNIKSNILSCAKTNAQEIIAGCEAERTATIDAINRTWTRGYFSYVFTLAEPPQGTLYSSMVGDDADRRPLFVVRMCRRFSKQAN
jgi:hypothetical protein